jgi:hypothetical protein
MKTTETTFVEDMGEAFMDGLEQALTDKSEAFSFAYTGDVEGEQHPIGCQEKMKCVVLMLPEPVADLFTEGFPVVRENLLQVLALVGQQPKVSVREHVNEMKQQKKVTGPVGQATMPVKPA